MKLCVSALVLLLVPALISGDTNQCTLSDLLSLSSLLKSMSSLILENSQLVCSDSSAKGAYATCPTGFTPTSCACGMGCGSWDVQSKTTCHCQCANIDWTSARCCKMAAKE
ncbi:resistin-like beta [Discoglossus pictus]